MVWDELPDGNNIMTTLIDDGLVESCLDDSITIVDFDQLPVIDVDNIDVTIEDPGYILDEPLVTLKRNEEHASAYKKQTFVLPVTFFDISRNISLLKKCRPISIKIVDCDIYPWYYKEMRNLINNNSNISNKDADLNQCRLGADTSHITDSTCHDAFPDLVCLASPTSPPKINLSSEQRSVVFKLTEKIENNTDENKVSKNVVDEYQDPKNPNKNHKGLLPLRNNISDCDLGKNIGTYDLLTYKAIAQTIVRNIDNNDVNNKTDNKNVYIQKPNVNRNNDIKISTKAKKFDTIKIEKNKGETEKGITSPILPYSVKRRQIPKLKDKMVAKSPKINNMLNKGNDFEKNCDKLMSSVQQVIPHYHTKQSAVPNYGNNFYYPHVIPNQMYSQEVTNNVSSFNHPQPSYRRNIISDNSGSFQPHIYPRRLVTSPNKVGERTCLNLNKECFNDLYVNSTQVVNEPFTENINATFHTPTPDHLFYYSNSSCYQNTIYPCAKHPNQIKANNRNLHFVRHKRSCQLSDESLHVFPQSSNLSNNICDKYNSMCSLNDYVNYSTSQISMQKSVSNVTNIVESNPLLSQLLTRNTLPGYYQSTLELHSRLDPRPALGRISYPSSGQNSWLPPRAPQPSPTYEYYYPSTQLTQDNNFQYSYAGMHLQQENINSYPHETNSNHERLEINLNEPMKYHNNLNNSIYIDAPNVTVSASPRIDSMKLNTCSHTEWQNINQVSSELCGIIDPNVLVNTNANINNQSFVNIPTDSVKNKGVKIPNKYNIDAMINVLGNNKSNCLYSKVHKCNKTAQEKRTLLKKNILQRHAMSDGNQLYTKSKIDKKLKNTLKSTRDVNKDTESIEKLESVINGYSPPILPIPSFKKSLEMLSGLHYPLETIPTENNNVKAETNKNIHDMPKINIPKFANIIRKRKLNEDAVFANTKRISLQEYMLRKGENVIAMN